MSPFGSRIGPAVPQPAEEASASPQGAATPAQGASAATAAAHIALQIDGRPAARAADAGPPRAARLPSRVGPGQGVAVDTGHLGGGGLIAAVGLGALGAGSWFMNQAAGRPEGDPVRGVWFAVAAPSMAIGAVATVLGGVSMRRSVAGSDDAGRRALDRHPRARDIAQALATAMQHLPGGEARGPALREAVSVHARVHLNVLADSLADLVTGDPASRQAAVEALANLRRLRSAVVEPVPYTTVSAEMWVAMARLEAHLSMGAPSMTSKAGDAQDLENWVEVHIADILKAWQATQERQAAARAAEVEIGRAVEFWSGVAQALAPQAPPIRPTPRNPAGRGGGPATVRARGGGVWPADPPARSPGETDPAYGVRLFDAARRLAMDRQARPARTAPSDPGPSSRP